MKEQKTKNKANDTVIENNVTISDVLEEGQENGTEQKTEKMIKPENAPLEEPKSYEEAIEAILFAAGHPVSYETLAKTFDLRAPILRNMVKDYAKVYNHSKVPRGVILLALDDECQLCTKEDYLAYIRFALGIRRNGTLSASTLETLAIVAYHQPVTRAYVDAVRGVDSSYAVSSLVERGLIEAKGRLDAPGRPVLFGTTSSFLRCFGLNSIDELPNLPSDEIAAVFDTVQKQMDEMAETDPNQLTIEDAEARNELEVEDNVSTGETVPTDQDDSGDNDFDPTSSVSDAEQVDNYDEETNENEIAESSQTDKTQSDEQNEDIPFPEADGDTSEPNEALTEFLEESNVDDILGNSDIEHK